MNHPSERSTLDLFRLTGKTALVTGGAGLLGAQFCRTLAQAGAQVVIADVNRLAGEELAASLTRNGYPAVAVQTDVTDPVSVRGMVAAALKAFGRLDILVNSAALDPKFDPQHDADEFARHGSGDFESFPLSAWEQALAVNLTGAFLCCQAGVQPMLEQAGASLSISPRFMVWQVRISASISSPAKPPGTSRSTTR